MDSYTDEERAALSMSTMSLTEFTELSTGRCHYCGKTPLVGSGQFNEIVPSDDGLYLPGTALARCAACSKDKKFLARPRTFCK